MNLPSAKGHHYTKAELIAIASIFILAVAPVNLLPMMVGTLMSLLSIDEAGAGILMTAELLAVSATVLILTVWKPALVNRRIAVIAVGLVIAAHGLTVLSESTMSYLPARLFAGVATGILLIGVNTRIAHSHDPVTLYGMCMASASIVAMLLFMLTPVIASLYGNEMLFAILACLGLLVLPFLRCFPRFSTHSNTKPLAQRKLNLPLCSTVIIPIFLVQMTQSSYFAFVEPMAKTHQLSPEEIGILLGVSCLAGILSSSLAAWIGQRWGQMLPLALSLYIHSLAIFVACFTDNIELFYGAVIVQTMCYFFAIPYQLGLVAMLDSSGRIASIGSAVFFLGVSCGPIVGGVLLANWGYSAIAFSVAISVVVSLCIFSRLNRLIASDVSTLSNNLNKESNLSYP